MNRPLRSVPYSIYIHTPFCRSKCPYCSFISVASNPIPLTDYKGAIEREWQEREGLAENQRLTSVYVGGGTPSLWQSEMLAGILELLGPLLEDVEVTVEVNPGDASPKWFQEMIRAGVNRFSIGAQSLDDDTLKWLGRRHSARDIRSAVNGVREAGDAHLSLDFIYGLPGQSPRSLEQALEAMAALRADHISAYELTAAEGTPLFSDVRSGDVQLPKNEMAATLWHCVGNTLGRFGYDRYEVSNYARKGRRSRHNVHYWTGGFYIGLGAGAHGFVKNHRAEMVRYANTNGIPDYIGFDMKRLSNCPEAGAGRKNPLNAMERIDDLTHAREKIMLAMRTTAGISQVDLLSKLPTKIQSKWRGLIKSAESDGFIRVVGDQVLPTTTGMIMADEVALGFF